MMHPGQALLTALVDGRRVEEPVLVLSPHPDDETIGLGGGMGRMEDCNVLFLTDGAPADPSLWGVSAPSRTAYARVREREARSALHLAGVKGSRIGYLPCTDLRSTRAIVPLTVRILEAVRAHGSSSIITTPYEGAHPDHDTAALIASLVSRASNGAVAVTEMASYHMSGGTLVAQRFRAGGPPAVLLRLTDDERTRKREMLRRYESQQRVLAPFGPHDEWLRPAPRYDFAAPPSDEVYYERSGLPQRWADWSRQALDAARVLFEDGGT